MKSAWDCGRTRLMTDVGIQPFGRENTPTPPRIWSHCWVKESWGAQPHGEEGAFAGRGRVPLAVPPQATAVALAFRSMLRSQVKRVRSGSPASGCRTMQLSRDSALRWGEGAGSEGPARGSGKNRTRRSQSEGNR